MKRIELLWKYTKKMILGKLEKYEEEKHDSPARKYKNNIINKFVRFERKNLFAREWKEFLINSL